MTGDLGVCQPRISCFLTLNLVFTAETFGPKLKSSVRIVRRGNMRCLEFGRYLVGFVAEYANVSMRMLIT